ncbi:MAG: hypothetical protein CMB72_01425 [Euryarchaeota archaeon]|nr:hypothetical protein [Euryarchaeota archaeon]
MFREIPEGAIQLVVSGTALATSVILPHGEVDGLRLCPFYHTTGIECPFCGMTRGFVAMSHLDPIAAIEFNLGTPFVYFAFIAVFTRSIWSLMNKRLNNQPQFPEGIFTSWLILSILAFSWMMYIRWIVPILS